MAKGIIIIAGIGLTGVKEDLSCYRAEIKIELQKLTTLYKGASLRIVSSLQEGAERMIVKVAQELGIAYRVLLPMPIKLYEKQFTEASRRELRNLLNNAEQIETVPWYAGNTADRITHPVLCSFQYRASGYKLARDCDEMIMLFNFEFENVSPGSIADIYLYRRSLSKPLHVIKCQQGRESPTVPKKQWLK